MGTAAAVRTTSPKLGAPVLAKAEGAGRPLPTSLEPDKVVLEATIGSYWPSSVAGGGRGQTKAGSTTHR
jgi:hypothetical protein